MTNKTITLSRELAQETANLIIRDICECEPDDNPESLCITVKALELILLQRLEGAPVADPVPPAGGEPLIHINQAVLSMLRGEVKASPGGITFSLSEPVGGWTVPLYEQHVVTRLQAEVERLKQVAIDRKNEQTKLCTERNDLQSELTKARELLADFAQWYDEPRLARPAVQIQRDVRELLSNQSAPADKEECTSCDGSGEFIDAIGDWRGYCSCAAGVALKNQPVPVAWKVEVDGMTLFHASPSESKRARNTPLYAEQPAPVAVVMPERMEIPSEHQAAYVYRKGWNACLDEVGRLNGVKP